MQHNTFELPSALYTVQVLGKDVNGYMLQSRKIKQHNLVPDTGYYLHSIAYCTYNSLQHSCNVCYYVYLLNVLIQGCANTECYITCMTMMNHISF